MEMKTFEEILNEYGSFEKYAVYLYKNRDTILRKDEYTPVCKPYHKQLEDFKNFKVTDYDIKSLIEDTKYL